MVQTSSRIRAARQRAVRVDGHQILLTVAAVGVHLDHVGLELLLDDVEGLDLVLGVTRFVTMVEREVPVVLLLVVWEDRHVDFSITVNRQTFQRHVMHRKAVQLIEQPVRVGLDQLTAHRDLQGNVYAVTGEHLEVALPEVELFLVTPSDPVIPTGPDDAPKVVLDKCKVSIRDLESQVAVCTHRDMRIVEEVIGIPLQLFQRYEERLTAMELHVVMRALRILGHELFHPACSSIRIELGLVTVLAIGKAMLAIQVAGTGGFDINGFVHVKASSLGTAPSRNSA
ncbi:hypothetical protein D3C87_1023590 [compost metagenome]